MRDSVGAALTADVLPASVRLPAGFYARPVLEVARDLVGCLLLHDGVGGVIVETEAYHECEPACHAHRGPTPRAKTLFEAPGTAYVYFAYGMHTLLNAVVEPEGIGAAVLIRAIEPVWGVDEMRLRRGRSAPQDLCSGPAKLTQALAVDLSHNRGSLVGGPIEFRSCPESWDGNAIASSPRIGISNARELPWRFYVDGNKYVSA